MSKKKLELIDLVPQYVKGELSSEKYDAFEKELENDQELQQEVDEYSAIYESYSDLPSKLPEPPADSFSKIMGKIEAEEKKQTKVKTKNNYSDIIKAIRNFFTLPEVSWTVAAAQLAVILILVFSGTDNNSFKTLSDGGDANLQSGVTFNVVFKDSAQQKLITELLNKIDASIIDGPATNGLYVLMVQDKARKNEVIKLLKESQEIKFVQVRY